MTNRVPLHTRLPAGSPRVLAWMAVILAAACCVWFAVQLAWTALTPLTAEPVLPSSPTASTSGKDAHATVAISQWHLFGNGHVRATRERIMKASQKTRLNLVLHGTVTGSDPEHGYALIAGTDGVEHSYRAGDTIQDGVKLQAVHATWVVLDHNGNPERLDLPRETLASAGRVQPLGKGSAGRRHGPPGAPGTPSAKQPIFVAPRVNTGRVDWQELQSEFQANPMAAAAELQLEPVFDGMQLSGVRIGSTRALPANTGLVANDVVTAVNGKALDSIADGEKLMQQLQGSGHVQLTVERNGQTRTLNIDLNQVR